MVLPVKGQRKFLAMHVVERKNLSLKQKVLFHVLIPWDLECTILRVHTLEEKTMQCICARTPNQTIPEVPFLFSAKLSLHLRLEREFLMRTCKLFLYKVIP